MFAVEVTRGNGYHCGCCRTESTDTEMFDSLEEVQEFVATIKFKRKNYERLRKLGLCHEDADDVYVNDIWQASKSLSSDSEAIEAMIAKMESDMKDKEAEAKEEAKRKKAAAREAAEKKRRELYEAMKEEYEGK